MALISLFLTFLLAITLLISGAMKFFDRNLTRQAAEAFGLPAPMSTIVAVALSPVEICIGLILFIPNAAPWAAASAALLLSVFTWLIINALRRGVAAPCNCFGTLSQAVVSRKTLFRNLMLLAIGVTIAWYPVTTSYERHLLKGLGVSGIALAALVEGALALLMVAVLTFLVLELIRQRGRLLIRLEKLESDGTSLRPGSPEARDSSALSRDLTIGELAPSFLLPDLLGQRYSLAHYLSLERPVAVLFLYPACTPCRALAPKVAHWQDTWAGRVTIVVISSGSQSENWKFAEGLGLSNVLIQDDREVAEAYRLRGTPSGVLVSTEGTIDSALAEGEPAIAALLLEAFGHAHRSISAATSPPSTLVSSRLPLDQT